MHLKRLLCKVEVDGVWRAGGKSREREILWKSYSNCDREE